ncbi:MAG: threonine synthase [Deltaproteobacteria bacterium]|nr:threonine synthase [Deltaproteobacteria bacterium]
MASARFRCLAGCAGEWPLTQAIYRCPTCNGLLDVVHDVTALRGTRPDAWKAVFDARYKRTVWPFGSGVWGKKEWVAPEVPDDAIVSLDEGGTNLFWAERFGRELGMGELWVKLCGNSHTGSFKDLGMTVLVSVVRWAMRDHGLKVRAIACASTGDTSASLAAYGASCGIPVIVLLPRGKVSTAQLVQPIANGAMVLALDTDFDGCMAVVQQLAAEGIVYLANSMNALRLEGQKTVAIEIVQQFDWQVPDWVILPSGNLGNASALHKGFQLLKDLGVTDRLPRLVVAQAERANPLVRAVRQGATTVTPMKAESTLATAIQIGAPVSAPRAMRALQAMNGLAVDATEDELADAAARADLTGMYCDPHTGVALAALIKLRAAGTIGEGERVVVVSTASGLKFTEFKIGYHERKLAGVQSRRANDPVILPPDFGKVVDAIQARFPG